MKKLLKRYWAVPCAFILVFAAVFASGLYFSSDCVTATLELSYENASKSENPDGSHFSVLDFKSDAFLERVAKNLFSSGHDVDEQEIANWFEVNPCGGYAEEYTATTYSISAETPVLSGVTSQEMLDAVVDAYQQQYAEQTSLNADFLEIDSEYVESLEYSDMYDYLLMKSKLFLDMVNECSDDSKIQNDWTFTETYQSLGKEISNFQSLSLTKLATYIEENRVYKNTREAQKKLLYKRFSTYKKYVEEKNQYNYIVSLLEDYNTAMINPIMVPMYNKTKQYFYMSLARIGTDILGEEAASMETTLRNMCLNLHKLDLAIDRTDGSIDSETVRKEATLAEEAGEMEDAAEDDIAVLYLNWSPNTQPNPGSVVSGGDTTQAESLLSDICAQYDELLARFESICAMEREKEYAHAVSVEGNTQSLMSKLSLKKTIVYAFAASVLVLLFVFLITKRARKEA